MFRHQNLLGVPSGGSLTRGGTCCPTALLVTGERWAAARGCQHPLLGEGGQGSPKGRKFPFPFHFFFSFFKFPLNFWCGVGGCKCTLRPCARMQLLEPFVRAVSDVTAGFHGLLMTGELRVWKGWAGLGGHAVKHLWALSSCGSRTHSPHRPPGTQIHRQPRSPLKPHPQIGSVTHRHRFRLDEAWSNPV